MTKLLAGMGASGTHTLSAVGGSLVVCLVTPGAVYLAADSRYAGAKAAVRDSARKLLPCGSSALCGISGLLRFTRTELDRRDETPASQMTFELAEIITSTRFETCEDTEPALASAFAECLYQALVPVWSVFANQLDRPFNTKGASITNPSILTLAELFYASWNASDRPFLCTITLKHSFHRSESGQYNSVLKRPVVQPVLDGPVTRPRIYLRGKRSCAYPPPVPGLIKGDFQAVEFIERIFRSAQLKRRCAMAIGGPIDIGVINPLGRRWLREKSACRIPVEQVCFSETS